MGLLSAKTRGRNMKKDNKKNHVFLIFGSKQPKDSSTPQSLISFILRQNSVTAQRMLEPTAARLGVGGESKPAYLGTCSILKQP